MSIIFSSSSTYFTFFVKKRLRNKNNDILCTKLRIDGRVVEGARLEIVCTSKGYREFESHSIRQSKKHPCGVFFCWQYKDRIRTHESEFDYKRKAYGSMLVGKADERSERSVSVVISLYPPLKIPRFMRVFFCFEYPRSF